MMVMFINYLILRSHSAVPAVLASVGTRFSASSRQLWLTGTLAGEPLVPPCAFLMHQLLATTVPLATEVLRHG